MVKNLRHIFDYYQNHTDKNKFDINITGGEPTVWPDLHNYCKELQEQHNVMTSIQSNGSRTVRWWKDNAKIFSKVLLSYHVGEGNLEHFTEVADICYEEGTFVVVTVCMDPKNWNKCIQAIDHFKSKSRNKWYIRLQHLEGNNIVYNEEQRNFLLRPVIRLPNFLYAIKHFKKFYNKESKIKFDTGKIIKASQHEISINGWNHFKGWECNLGIDSFQINYDGSISGGCGQKLFENYNIYDVQFEKKFNPLIKSVTCEIDICGCVPEINLNKKIIPINLQRS
jgi:organic radical activating enzyme